jgi:hypothetical protein
MADLITPQDRDLITEPEPPDPRPQSGLGSAHGLADAELLSFGQKMVALKKARGIPQSVGAGRKPIAERYKRQISAAERTFAGALEELATEYVAELRPHDPERCPVHRHILCCPDPGCEEQSQRTAFNFKAASYVFDRIQGKPTTRVEASIQATFVEQLTLTLVTIFTEVNTFADADVRRQAFADACRGLIAAWGGGGG